MIIDWERLFTAGKIVFYGSFTITLLVIGIVWFYNKCQENDGYKFGFALFIILLILVEIVYVILGAI